MDELISKKDLLIKANISYGQLYRWKRKNIIPEEWFIKKSTFTGQETFFPKEKILERIDLILSMKDDVSLDDIANMFTKKTDAKEFNMEIMLDKKVISNYTKDIFYNFYQSNTMIGRKELLAITIIEKYLVKSVITMEEMKSIISIINNDFEKIYKDNSKIYVFRKLGVPFVVGCIDYKQVIFDKELIKIIEIDIMRETSEMSKNLII
ncbi:MAG: DUF4004 family protein [Peptostreptococcaceae bacterium]